MKSFFKKIICTVISAAMVLSLAAVNVSAAKPALSTKSVNIPIGSSATVTVNGASKVVWTNNNTDIVSHKQSGNTLTLTALRTGATYMIADVGGTKLKCKVTVKQSFIETSRDSVELEKGKSQTVTIKVKGSKNIAVSSSDKSVCTASLGKWNGDAAVLTVKAKKNGTATVKVYTKKFEGSTVKEIFVNVGGQTVDNSPTEEELLAAEVIKMVNKERKAAGLSKLKSSNELNAVAAIRAKELIEEYSHTRPDGSSCGTVLDDAGIAYMVRGENIGWNQKNTAERIMKDWMESPKHKANILGKQFGKIGVACYKYDGKYYWVQVFTD